MPHMPRAPALALAALLLALPAAGQEMDARYDLSMRGITAGQIVIRAREAGGAYAVNAAGQPTGLVGALSDYSYSGEAQGRVADGRLVAAAYAEREVDDGKVTTTRMTFRGTTPAEVQIEPPREPRPYDVEPTAQRGVVDTLTGLYAVLRDTDRAGACAQSHDLFDGRRVARLSLGPAEAGADGTIRCRGEYRRVAGYDPEDMARRPATPLTFVYGPAGGEGRVRVVEVRSPSRLGEVVLRRR